MEEGWAVGGPGGEGGREEDWLTEEDLQNKLHGKGDNIHFHTSTQHTTHGYVDSMTDLARRAKSM